MGEDDKGFAAPGSFPPTQPAESENPGAGRAAGQTGPDAPPPASQLGGWAGFGAGPNPYQSPYEQQADDPRGSQPYSAGPYAQPYRSEEHTSELQSRGHLVCRLLLETKKERSKKRVTS